MKKITIKPIIYENKIGYIYGDIIQVFCVKCECKITNVADDMKKIGNKVACSECGEILGEVKELYYDDTLESIIGKEKL